jgi:hypothetical protein
MNYGPSSQTWLKYYLKKSKRGVAPPTYSRSARCRSFGASSQKFAEKTKFHNEKKKGQSLMNKQIWHWGNYSGFFGFFSRLVDDNAALILLRNTSPLTVSQDELRPIITDVAEILFEEE